MISLAQEYFSNAAKQFPEKTALCCKEESITYAEAECFTNALARELKNQGAERGTFVPFFMKKSINSVLSVLAVLKADCAYVPLDSNSPAPRLAAILESAQAPIVIVDSDSKAIFESLIPEEKRPILINISLFEVRDNTPLEYQNISIDIAYVLFTSGSTGTPKGVMISHRAITDYIDSCVEAFEINDKDVVSNHAPVYFDLSTFDMYTSFKTGASLHLVHEELNLVLPRLIKWLNEHKITILFCVPSVLTLLLKSRRLKPDSLPTLRHIICAGEVLPPAVLREWMLLYPHIQFSNMYGPTEITVTCCYHMVREIPAEDCKSIPIGAPRDNMELFVLTEDSQSTKVPGIQGELIVRGTSVAYGYLGDADKTEKAFVQNPMHNLYSDPVYRTGDLVSFMDNGEINYLGRIDHQIKHLGYRIELGEIEAALSSFDVVEESVVVYGSRSNEEENEIGALVSFSAEADLDQFKKSLKEKLPSYMVPTHFKIISEDFPQTPNGKYDRKTISNLVFE